MGMIVKLFFTQTEIAAFFRENGFTVEQRTFGRYEKRYHNRDEWVEYDDDAVIIGQNHVKADVLFERIAEYRLKRVCTPVNTETKRAIENTFKAILK
jgi:hypothetical protein